MIADLMRGELRWPFWEPNKMTNTPRHGTEPEMPQWLAKELQEYSAEPHTAAVIQYINALRSALAESRASLELALASAQRERDLTDKLLEDIERRK